MRCVAKEKKMWNMAYVVEQLEEYPLVLHLEKHNDEGITMVDAPPNFLIDSTASPKVKRTKG